MAVGLRKLDFCERVPERARRPSQGKGIAMLVLSRKAGETVRIGNDVRVTVLRIGPSSVRVGIEAPSYLGIVREELEFEVPVEQFAGVDRGESAS